MKYDTPFQYHHNLIHIVTIHQVQSFFFWKIKISEAEEKAVQELPEHSLNNYIIQTSPA